MLPANLYQIVGPVFPSWKEDFEKLKPELWPLFFRPIFCRIRALTTTFGKFFKIPSSGQKQIYCKNLSGQRRQQPTQSTCDKYGNRTTGTHCWKTPWCSNCCAITTNLQSKCIHICYSVPELFPVWIISVESQAACIVSCIRCSENKIICMLMLNYNLGRIGKNKSLEAFDE